MESLSLSSTRAHESVDQDASRVPVCAGEQRESSGAAKMSGLEASISKMTPYELAEIELDAFSQLFANTRKSCLERCVSSSFHDSDLSKSESVCIDRCVMKFLEAHEFVSKKFNEMQMQAQNQAQGGGAA
jgi:hypothetical protein